MVANIQQNYLLSKSKKHIAGLHIYKTAYQSEYATPL